MNHQLKVKDGYLAVTRELRMEYDTGFDAACSVLLESKGKLLVIDLGDARYIGSVYIGIIAATYFQAFSQGKLLKVVATPEVIKLLEMAGFVGHINLEGRISPQIDALPEALPLSTVG